MLVMCWTICFRESGHHLQKQKAFLTAKKLVLFNSFLSYVTEQWSAMVSATQCTIHEHYIDLKSN